jgi:hypothetical protein
MLLCFVDGGSCSFRFKASGRATGGAATLPEGDTMYLIALVALAMAFIVFATAKLNLHPFLTLSATACGFGALFGMPLLAIILLSLFVL